MWVLVQNSLGILNYLNLIITGFLWSGKNLKKSGKFKIIQKLEKILKIKISEDTQKLGKVWTIQITRIVFSLV